MVCFKFHGTFTDVNIKALRYRRIQNNATGLRGGVKVFLDSLRITFYFSLIIQVLQAQIKGNPVRIRNGPAAVTGDEGHRYHC
jgi:hypothetical protein